VGDVLQGAAADCNSAEATHAWFDSRVAHHLPFRANQINALRGGSKNRGSDFTLYVRASFRSIAATARSARCSRLAATVSRVATHNQRHNLIGRVMPSLRDGQMRTMEQRHIRLVMLQVKHTPHQVNNRLQVLRAMFKFGLKTGHLEAAPSVRVERHSKVTEGFRPWEIRRPVKVLHR
jgi:hypothetical protein